MNTQSVIILIIIAIGYFELNIILALSIPI